ncbi:VanZ family protein [Fulvivirgaceae bacterium BMA10]|uniref:VanZ family protein n=1 Tax=Splendidivirga corallicola TaxID=3051826 RepID=A0ABT8KVD4_9BACT|nr:VanZ family protein [Fulvivirgaceae bacterium BMA10]
MFIKYNALTLIWVLLIAILTLTPGNSVPDVGFWYFPHMDKVVHLGIFAVLVFLMIRGLRKQSSFPGIQKRAIGASILISLIYGVLIELIQIFVPFRSFEFEDVIANAVGCGTGYLVTNLVQKI